MARKSRKNIETNEVNLVTEIFKTALYIRLSVEDCKRNGNSIESQKSVLDSFVAKSTDITVVETYIDDGATGTNFERKGFKRLLEDIENGKINCVIVKDLSRLGRNVVDTGFYIEKYFVEKDVRFIAIGDDYDSIKTEDFGGIILPIKNLINEAYSLDIGRKIKAQQQQCIRDGEFVGGRPPYGYTKAQDNCRKLIVDEKSAKVIRLIFEMAFEGVSKNAIVVRLNEMEIDTPSHYRKSQGIINHENLLGNNKWQTRTIDRILQDRVYVGDMVQGKSTVINHRQTKVPKDNWVTIKNTHEKIVSSEVFNTVQEIRSKIYQVYKGKKKVPYEVNLFKGKIFCVHCGKALHFKRDNRANEYYYFCLSNSRIAKGSCAGVNIMANDVKAKVLDYLSTQLKTIGETSSCNGKKSSEDSSAKLIALTANCKKELESKQRFLKSLYENVVNGVLTNEEYFELKESYQQQIVSTTEQIQNMENKISQSKKQALQLSELTADINTLNDGLELNADMIGKSLDRIIVDHDHNIVISDFLCIKTERGIV